MAGHPPTARLTTVNDSLDVHVHGITAYDGKRRTTHTLKWSVAGKRWQRTFDTRKLADSFRSELVAATRKGTPFDVATGQPATHELRKTPSWLDHAIAFVDRKWPHASPRHRKGIAEGLTRATVAMLPASVETPLARRVLRDWAFNAGARQQKATRGDDAAAATATLTSLRRGLPKIDDRARPTVLRPVLDALSRNIDGSPAAPSTVARKRSALYSALDYAVEMGHLTSHPMDRVSWRAAQGTDVVDRRVVINPVQAAALLEAVKADYPALEAFYACLYYAALRPSEVRHLRAQDLDLPHTPGAWGSLLLVGGVPPTQVAEWAGHSVNVLLRVYASCVAGQDELARQRVAAALGEVRTSSLLPPRRPHTAVVSRRQPDTGGHRREGP